MTSKMVAGPERKPAEASELNLRSIFVFAPSIKVAEEWKRTAQLQGMQVSEYIVDRVLISNDRDQYRDRDENRKSIEELTQRLNEKDEELARKLGEKELEIKLQLEASDREFRTQLKNKEEELALLGANQTRLESLIKDKDKEMKDLGKERDYYKRLYETVNEELRLARAEEI